MIASKREHTARPPHFYSAVPLVGESDQAVQRRQLLQVLLEVSLQSGSLPIMWASDALEDERQLGTFDELPAQKRSA